ncbi:hypothetical protein QF050_000607 [Arthrobacter sp. SLBN-112]|nr:hypothetical protein [Arthrobacter sp. SLBN-112]
MHDQLQGQAAGAQVAGVLAGVKEVVDAGLVGNDAAGVAVEVQVVGAPVGEGHAVVLELGQVFGGHQVPRRSGLRIGAHLVKVEEPELAILLEGDKVANPRIGGLEEDWVAHQR